MGQLCSLARIAAAMDLQRPIQGETGIGKEPLARAVISTLMMSEFYSRTELLLNA
jgi:transcriptional regulator with GAF, ATPase, and Fis domain